MIDFDIDFCPHCGTMINYRAGTCPICCEELPDEAFFCPHCGEEVWEDSLVCDECGKEITEEDIENYHQLSNKKKISLREAYLRKNPKEDKKALDENNDNLVTNRKLNNNLEVSSDNKKTRMPEYVYRVLDNNFDAICDVIANKGAALKELVNLFEKEGEWHDIILPIVYGAGEEGGEEDDEAVRCLSEKLEISPNTACYLLNLTFEEICALDVKVLKKMLKDYKTNIGKMVIK